jgi:alkaline phosphatase D
MAKAADPTRTMLGAEQEAWLADQLKASTARGHTWQILGNQVIMARVVPPNVHDALPADQRAELSKLGPWVENLIQFTRLGLPWNLDAWDGYPAARERLYAAAEAAGARLITLTGDTHTAWANELHSGGKKLGAEFGCTSVSSPGMGDILKLPGYGEMMAAKNDEVVWHNPNGRGFTVLNVAADAVTAEFVLVSTAFAKEFTTSVDRTFRVEPDTAGIKGVVGV